MQIRNHFCSLPKLRFRSRRLIILKFMGCAVRCKSCRSSATLNSSCVRERGRTLGVGNFKGPHPICGADVVSFDFRSVQSPLSSALPGGLIRRVRMVTARADFICVNTGALTQIALVLRGSERYDIPRDRRHTFNKIEQPLLSFLNKCLI